MHVSVSVTEVASITRLICEPKNPELPEKCLQYKSHKRFGFRKVIFRRFILGRRQIFVFSRLPEISAEAVDVLVFCISSTDSIKQMDVASGLEK